MLRAFRGLCLICFCILGVALIVVILEVAALPMILNATDCRAHFEILTNFTCGDGLVRRTMEIVLDLPRLFVYAPMFTIFVTARLARNFMLLLYLFDLILILALTYPFLFLFARKRGAQSS
jgi:hypothetical protein